MDKATARDKVIKLLAKAESCRKIPGAEAEAATAEKIARRLMRKHGITKQSLKPPKKAAPTNSRSATAPPRRTQAGETLSGKFKCSCGAQITLSLDPTNLGNWFALGMLAIHKRDGHQLKQIA